MSSSSLRHLGTIDRCLAAFEHGLRTLQSASHASRPMPRAPRSAEGAADAHPPAEPLSPEDRALAGSLMRVNHVGEVCAQALYQAQALGTRNAELREHLLQAAREETDHLAWCESRLKELNARPSLLNPVWYAGAFALGLVAARAGDAVSLGFVVETERQVEEHLRSHLDRLPSGDADSRAVVAAMRDDEVRHGREAESAGAAALPMPIRGLMQLAAGVMTRTAHHL